MQPSDSKITRPSLLIRLRDLQDEAAWSHFVDVYGPFVASWCQGIGLQEADAADVTQAVLLKLMTVVQQWNYDPSKGSFRGWLKQVTQNVAVDLQRGWKEQTAGNSEVMSRLSNLPDSSVEDSLWDTIESAYQREVLMVANQRVQLRVQPKNWQAYYRTSVDGESAASVAESLAIPIGEVYVARSRILKMLKSEVELIESQGMVK
jgi:RNA polymerase sigma-70 factor, ECF subfamily